MNKDNLFNGAKFGDLYLMSNKRPAFYICQLKQADNENVVYLSSGKHSLFAVKPNGKFASAKDSEYQAILSRILDTELKEKMNILLKRYPVNTAIGGYWSTIKTADGVYYGLAYEGLFKSLDKSGLKSAFSTLSLNYCVSAFDKVNVSFDENKITPNTIPREVGKAISDCITSKMDDEQITDVKVYMQEQGVYDMNDDDRCKFVNHIVGLFNYLRQPAQWVENAKEDLLNLARDREIENHRGIGY